MRVRTPEHVALPSAFREALPMLADDEVIEKARRARLGEHIPGNRQCKHEEEPGDPRHAFPDGANAALPERPDNDGCERQHEGDGSFGEEPDREPDEE